MARLAAEAPGLRIGSGIVLLALHKPLDLAEQFASLDVIAGGKVIFRCRHRIPRCRVQGVRDLTQGGRHPLQGVAVTDPQAVDRRPGE